jgi:hypothetical protein
LLASRLAYLFAAEPAGIFEVNKLRVIFYIE